MTYYEQTISKAECKPRGQAGMKTVLIVEDNDINCDLLVQMLEPADLDIRTASNGQRHRC